MILTYSIKHRKDYTVFLSKAKLVADYAVLNKKNKKLLSTKYVKHIGLPSAIANQILRKYSGKTIKEAKNVNMIAPNQSIDYDYDTGIVNIKPLKVKFRWNCGRRFIKINQIEITNNKYYICVSFPDVDQKLITNDKDILTIDLNCGLGRSIAVCTDFKNGKLLTFGKEGPNLRKKYYKLRQRNQKDGRYDLIKKLKNKESRIMKNLDHQISRKIVNYAIDHNLKIVMEDLNGIRRTKTKGNGSSKIVNRIINSWSFYRLQSYIDYKAKIDISNKLYGIPVEYVKPHYTSQHCNYCGTLGERKSIYFKCKSKTCIKYDQKQNSDINATYNIGRRYQKTL